MKDSGDAELLENKSAARDARPKQRLLAKWLVTLIKQLNRVRFVSRRDDNVDLKRMEEVARQDNKSVECFGALGGRCVPSL